MISIIRVREPLWGIESTSFCKVLNEEAKRTPGMRWNPELRAWVGYADAVHVTARRSHERGLRIQGWLEGPSPTGLLVASKGLRDYQRKGVEFLIAKSSEGCILADDLGLGKTLQAITAARAIKQRTVVCCPNLLKGVWLDPQEGELHKWWPAAKVMSAATTKPCAIDPELDVVVVHYEILHAWVDALIEWGARVLILDEGQFLMGRDARRTRAAKKLAEACRHRMMLTGTPIQSRIRDLWAPMDVISPGRFGEKFFKFGIHHCAGHEEQIEYKLEGVKMLRNVWKFDGASNTEELNERLVYSRGKPWGCMLRRLKSEVALELPAKTRQILPIEVERKFIAPMAGIRSDKLLRMALDQAADGKWPRIVELAQGHLERGSTVAIGCYRRSVAELIADGIPGAVVIHGGIGLSERQAAIKKRPKCLVCTIDSTVAGINLSAWNVGIVAELMWVPASLVQWEGRFGREAGRNVLIQYPIAAGTADDWVKRIVLAKLDAFQATIGGNDDKLDEDLKALTKEGAAERMRRLYEALVAADAA